MHFLEGWSNLMWVWGAQYESEETFFLKFCTYSEVSWMEISRRYLEICFCSLLFSIMDGFALDVVVSNSHLSRNFLDSWDALQIFCIHFNLGFIHITLKVLSGEIDPAEIRLI